MIVATNQQEGAAHEPGGPLHASARLVRVLDGAASPRALVRIDMLSAQADADVIVSALERSPDGRATNRRARAIAQASLTRGRRQAVVVERDLLAGRENHLFFELAAQRKGGAKALTQVYLRVNLDESLEPRALGDVLEYDGATGGQEP